MHLREFYINSSDIAGFIGLVPIEWREGYKNRVLAYNNKNNKKTIERPKIFNDMEKYIQIKKQTNDIIKKEDIEKVLVESENVKKEKEEVYLQKKEKVESPYKDVDIKDIPKSLQIPTGTTSQYTEVIYKQINMERGNKHEGLILAKLAKEWNRKIDTLQKIKYTSVYDSTKRIKIKIGARPDGIMKEDGKKVIIEIKNRNNRIMIPIPEYEKVQVTFYLKIFQAEKCILVQRLPHTSGDDEYHITEIFMDNDYLRDIEIRLINEFFQMI